MNGRADNLLHRQILPALNKCKACGKQESEHVLPDHEYERNDALPEWRGFHAARRGLASNLYALGVTDIVIQRILRHSDVSITQRCYIKPLDESTKDAMDKLEKSLSATVLPPTSPEAVPNAATTKSSRIQ